jgi:hypothetical protein
MVYTSTWWIYRVGEGVEAGYTQTMVGSLNSYYKNLTEGYVRLSMFE